MFDGLNEINPKGGIFRCLIGGGRGGGGEAINFLVAKFLLHLA